MEVPVTSVCFEIRAEMPYLTSWRECRITISRRRDMLTVGALASSRPGLHGVASHTRVADSPAAGACPLFIIITYLLLSRLLSGTAPTMCQASL
jgi:hypothetical protein